MMLNAKILTAIQVMQNKRSTWGLSKRDEPSGDRKEAG
jgi:hypothetical protein